MEPLSFRLTEETDIPLIMSWERLPDNEPWIFPYEYDRHKSVIQRHDEFHYLALLGKEPVAFFIMALTEKEHHSMELRRLVVDMKGQKIATRCFDKIKAIAFDHHQCHRIWLDVFTDNTRALALYLKQGFQHEGIKRSTILGPDGWRDQRIMSLIRNDLQEPVLGTFIDLNHRFFRVIENVEHGDSHANTLFHYRQQGKDVWATYAGGGVQYGTLSGYWKENLLEFQYQHHTASHVFKRGRCTSNPEWIGGKLRFYESWEWSSGESGHSWIEEI